MFIQQQFSFKALRPATRPEGSIQLTKRRAWFDNVTAYGFVTLKDLFRERVNTVGFEQVNTAVQESIEEYNRELDAMLDQLVEPTTEYQIRYTLPSGGSLQPLDQHGNPVPVQPSGKYDVAFPIQGAGTAWGDNRVTRAKMTVGEANRFTLDVQARDADWMARHILAAIFTNTTNGWTFPDEEHGDISVQGLANGDTVVYVRRGGASSTDNHYLAQANAISNTDNPFPIIDADLSEHPSNSGDTIVYVPTNLVAGIKALDTFIPVIDGAIQPGNASDTLTRTIDPGFGDEVLGYVDGCWIVEWKRLPDNYMVAISAGAPPVLAMREHPEPELQGLFPEFQDVDGNRHLNKFIRYCGFGVQNRVGALVYRIGNASYAIPTGYQAPLPA